MREIIRTIIWENKPSQEKAAEQITNLVIGFMEWFEDNNEVFRRKYWEDGKYYYDNILGGEVKSYEQLFEYWVKTKDYECIKNGI